MTPDQARAIKILCEIHEWTEGDFACFGDAPKHVRQVDMIETALRAARGEVHRELVNQRQGQIEAAEHLMRQAAYRHSFETARLFQIQIEMLKSDVREFTEAAALDAGKEW